MIVKPNILDFNGRGIYSPKNSALPKVENITKTLDLKEKVSTNFLKESGKKTFLGEYIPLPLKSVFLPLSFRKFVETVSFKSPFLGHGRSILTKNTYNRGESEIKTYLARPSSSPP